MTSIIERATRCMVGDKPFNKYKVREYITLKCDKCPHLFSAIKYNIIRKEWCPYCCRSNRKLCDDISCQYCLDRSLYGSRPELFNPDHKGFIWSDKNSLSPKQVTRKSNKIAIFLCTICNHESVKSIHNSIYKCKYCIRNTYLCGKKECKWCWNKSFATDPLAKYMIGNPWMYTKYSKKKCMFKCDKCNGIFQKSLGCMGRMTRCPLCRELL